MTNPTSNFGWQMPTSTDLVTDLPADFEVFGQAVDTSLADLKGGTTGQVLKKNSNTDMDFVWSADAAGMTNPMTTTGDTIYSSSGSTPARLGIGSTGQILTVAGGVPSWATPAASTLAVAQIATGSITSGTQLQLTGLTSYDELILKVSGNTWDTGSGYISATLNNTTSTYDQISYGLISGSTYNNGNFNSSITTTNQISTLNGFVGSSQDRITTTNARFLYLQNCKATGFTTFQWIERWRNGNGDDVTAISNGIFKTAAAISTIEYKQNNGYTFSAGTYTLWGA